MIYEIDGQCDFIYTQDCSRCLRTACWLHLPSGLCYCHQHAKYYEEKPADKEGIEKEWEPL